MKKIQVATIAPFLFSLFLGAVESELFEYELGESENFLEPDEFSKIYPPINPLTNQPLTQDEWDKILEAETKKYKDRLVKAPTARAAPFCVDGNLPVVKAGKEDLDKDLENFKDLLDHPFTDDEVRMTNKNGKSKGGFIKTIKFLSLHSPDEGPTEKENGPEEIGIGRMNQWTHIVITAEKDLIGLYIQGISGPLGIPFGEFRTDFDCKLANQKDVLTKVNPYPDKIPSIVSMVVPCKYAPRAAIRHPTVYVYGGSKQITWEPKKEFHVHFNWEDVKCLDASRMQFLIVAVEDFADSYEALLTPAYEQEIDSGDGIPYPFYVQWNQDGGRRMICKDDGDSTKSTYQFIYSDVSSVSNIIYDPAYDRCIQSTQLGTNEGFPLDYEEGHMPTCPPGPFLCTKGRMASDGSETTVSETRLTIIKDTTADCEIKHCIHPKLTEPKLKPPPTATSATDMPSKTESSDVEQVVVIDEQYEETLDEFIKNGIYAQKKSRSNHAKMMTLAVCLFSIATLMARFYKETCGLTANGTNGWLGIGPWLWGHLLLSYFAITMIWIGIIEIINLEASGSIACEIYANGTDLEKNCIAKRDATFIHGLIGSLSLVCIHWCFLSGWVRPFGTAMRQCMVTSHMFGGFGGKIFTIASVAALLKSPEVCKEIIFEVVSVEVVGLIVFIVMTCVQNMEDGRLGVSDRKNYPVPEAIQVSEGGQSCAMPKTLVYVVTWILHVVLFFIVVMSYIKIFSDVDSSSDINGTIMLKGILGSECMVPSVETFLSIIRPNSSNSMSNIFLSTTPAAI